MSRLATLAVAVALALPVLVLAGMVAEAEWGLRDGTVIRVPITGYDPRDALRGHYLRYRFAWNWQDGRPDDSPAALCLLATGDDPPVRPLPPGGDPACRLVLRRDAGGGGGFVPAGVSDQLFIPEERAQALQSALVAGTAAITVDLAIRPDGTARMKGWHVGGKPPAP